MPGIRGSLIASRDTEGLFDGSYQGMSLGVSPGAIDVQGIALPRFKNGPYLLAGRQADLDASRIEQQGQALLPSIPKLLVKFLKRQIH